MDQSALKQEFSIAYVHALATVAGFAFEARRVDVDSVDGTFSASRGSSGMTRSPRLDIQLKCTDIGNDLSKDFNYPLKVKNYDDLRDVHRHVPCVLVIVAIPKAVPWCVERPMEFALLHRAFWLDLRGKPPTQSKATLSQRVILAQPFDVATLAHFMQQIDTGTY